MQQNIDWLVDFYVDSTPITLCTLTDDSSVDDAYSAEKEDEDLHLDAEKHHQKHL